MKTFFKYYKPHYKLFFIDMTAATILAGIDMIFPLYSKSIIDKFIPNKQVDMIIKYSILILFLYIIRLVCNYIMAYWGHVMGARIEYDMRNDLFKHIQTLPFKYFDDNKTGKIMSRIINDLNEVSELAHHGPEDFFISAIMIIGSLAIMFTLNGVLAFTVMIIVFFMVAYSIRSRINMVRTFRNVRKKTSDINARVENSISGIRLSKSFANEDYEIEKFKESNSFFRNSKNASFKAIGYFSSGNHFLSDILNLSVISIGGVLTYRNVMSPGDLMAFSLYTAFFLRPIRRLIQFTQQFQSGMAGFERFLELMNTKSDITDCDNPVSFEKIEGNLEFKDVSFRYEDDMGYVLKNFDISITSGSTVALVGPSGVGKTTIANLIPRFYDVQGGSINIDDVDIKNISLKILRKNIGIVQQDVFIFYGTIFENIIYGRPDACEEEVIDAAKKANIYEFIISLENGFETIVGERGIKLSGGQKQRIAIARVFLKNPAILILDEATSSLDNENELAIQKSIEELSKNRTTVIIAHRLSTIKNADEILVLTGEGISERGKHEDLISRKGIYCNLYNAQFKGFIPDEI